MSPKAPAESNRKMAGGKASRLSKDQMASSVPSEPIEASRNRNAEVNKTTEETYQGLPHPDDFKRDGLSDNMPF